MMLVLVREVMNEYFPLPVEHVPHDLLPCANQAQGACSGDTKVVHGLATHELADAGAQHCPTISHAGVGRPACTLHPLCQPSVHSMQSQGSGVSHQPETKWVACKRFL